MMLSRMQSVLSAVVFSFAMAAVGQGAAAPATNGAAGTADATALVKVPPLDVISVKPNKSGSGGSSWGPTPDGVMGKNITVHLMLMNAYHLNESRLIDEPKWSDEEHFDISGKVAAADAATVPTLPMEQKRRAFFQQVLKDRFGLVAHHETRELPEYALVAAKGGVKLEDGKPDPNAPPGSWSGGFSTGMGGGIKKMKSAGVSIDPLLQFLSNETGRTVVDKAGLTGMKYYFTLSWRPATAQGAADDAADSTPDLFTAIQEQLGLKLEPVKGPVNVLVIDHLERPAEN